jgi:hypothetical protein
MTRLATLAIPFEKQLPSRSSRMCGAAALCMVYRSLGVESSQHRLWEQIARPDSGGTRAARTHLLAASAMRHGLASVCLEASRPWLVLQHLASRGVRAVLNHRLRPGSPLGHYTVLVGIDGGQAILHDPQLGPDRRLARDDLLALWRPADDDSEVAGHVLVAIGPPETRAAACRVCTAAIPASTTCPRCRSEVPLRPGVALGCGHQKCPGRLWKRLFCPYCDASILDP